MIKQSKLFNDLYSNIQNSVSDDELIDGINELIIFNEKTSALNDSYLIDCVKNAKKTLEYFSKFKQVFYLNIIDVKYSIKESYEADLKNQEY